MKVKIMLRLTTSRIFCLGVRHPSGAHDQFFFFLLQRPLWSRDQSSCLQVRVRFLALADFSEK
jgi:hypothetical protein